MNLIATSKPCVTKIYVKRFLAKRHFDKVYTSALIEFETNVCEEEIHSIIIRRYQLGEVNNIKYADTVTIKKDELYHHNGSKSYGFLTDMLGYGESVGCVTYFMEVMVVACGKNNVISSGEFSDILSVTTPDGVDFGYKEEIYAI